MNPAPGEVATQPAVAGGHGFGGAPGAPSFVRNFEALQSLRVDIWCLIMFLIVFNSVFDTV